jgi:hypothetical protein
VTTKPLEFSNHIMYKCSVCNEEYSAKPTRHTGCPKQCKKPVESVSTASRETSMLAQKWARK